MHLTIIHSNKFGNQQKIMISGEKDFNKKFLYASKLKRMQYNNIVKC